MSTNSTEIFFRRSFPPSITLTGELLRISFHFPSLVSVNSSAVHVFFLIRNWFIRNEYYTGRKIKKL